MKNSYFLLTILPPLEFAKKPFISWDETVSLVENNSSSLDLHQLRQLQLLKDIENCQKLFSKLPLEIGGTLNQERLVEAIEEKSYFPKPVLDYLETYSTNKERLQYFPLLIRSIYNLFGQERGFIGRYIAFEEKAKMLLALLRSLCVRREKLAEPILPLIETDEDDPFFQRLFEMTKATTDELNPPFMQLKEIYDAKHNFPFELEYALTEWRYYAYEELASPALFSFDQVLLYLTQWQLLNRLSSFEMVAGLKKFETIIEAS